MALSLQQQLCCSFSLLLIQQQQLPFRSQCLFVNVAKVFTFNRGKSCLVVHRVRRLSDKSQQISRLRLETCYLRQEIEIRSFTWWHFSYCLILKKEEGGKHPYQNIMHKGVILSPSSSLALHSVRNYIHQRLYYKYINCIRLSTPLPKEYHILTLCEQLTMNHHLSK